MDTFTDYLSNVFSSLSVDLAKILITIAVCNGWKRIFPSKKD